MWRYDYQNRPIGSSLRQHRLESGRDFKGCEMNETFGWGEQAPAKRAPLTGIFALLASFFDLDPWGVRK